MRCATMDVYRLRATKGIEMCGIIGEVKDYSPVVWGGGGYRGDLGEFGKEAGGILVQLFACAEGYSYRDCTGPVSFYVPSYKTAGFGSEDPKVAEGLEVGFVVKNRIRK